MAYGASNDFTFLDLRRPAFDLTDRGVDGRASPGEIDAYLYTDRGVYRPGETVNVHHACCATSNVKALRDTPLTFVALASRRPGVRSASRSNRAQEPAARLPPVTLTDTAPRGRWQLAVYRRSEGRGRSAASRSTCRTSCRKS